MTSCASQELIRSRLLSRSKFCASKNCIPEGQTTALENQPSRILAIVASLKVPPFQKHLQIKLCSTIPPPCSYCNYLKDNN